MAQNISWTCPYCQKIATITANNTSRGFHSFSCNNKTDGQLGLASYTIVCPNAECREFTVEASLYKAQHINHQWTAIGEPLYKWRLKPQSRAKPFPSYIPEPLRLDYEEACAIASLSPKASATLARRCLQGMIRDFWGISKSRLADEIAALSEKVDSTTREAIDAVRSIGNIGAHMEKDINLVIDVDPEEAALLLGLIEVLFEDWYVHRHNRSEHMKKVVAAAQTKAEAKKIALP